jgi:nicotinamidase/pyrazinamidase
VRKVARIGASKNSALIIVDMQKDFCEGGALPVKGCSSLIPTINTLVKIFEDSELPIIASRDWHPQNHISFKKRGGPWPPHCIQGTEGTEFHPDLKIPGNTIIISKGYLPDRDAYSAFDGTELHYILSLKGVKRLFVTGVATEYCVKATAADALKLGYEVIVLEDCIAPVSPEDGDKALQELLKKGAVIATSSEVVKT